MNIRDLGAGPNRMDSVRSGSANEASKAGSPASSPEASQSAGGASGADQVDISAAARRVAESTKEIQELAVGRKAMLSIPPLSQERASDILRRIQEGYYSQPEVVKSVADGVASDLLGEPPAQL